MTYSLAAARAIIHGSSGREPVQVVYTTDEIARLFGRLPQTVRGWIASGVMLSRNTGHSYLIPGGHAIDLLGRPAPGINDHRTVIDVHAGYTVDELTVMLGLKIDAVRRLARPGGPLKVEHRRPRLIVLGQALLDYLDGSDEPIRHPDSA